MTRFRTYAKRLLGALLEATRRYFAAGLLAFAPLAITLWALVWIVNRLDNLLLPKVMALVFPGMDATTKAPPLVGAIFTFLVILLAGVFVRHFFGSQFVRITENVMSRVPVARSIYGAVKQLFEAIFGGAGSAASFNRVVLIEYPRKGTFALAFTTGTTRGPVTRALEGLDLVNCFVPTTPNPTSGFYLMLERHEIRNVDISVEEAFKVIMSAGLVTPRSIAETERQQNLDLDIPVTATPPPSG